MTRQTLAGVSLALLVACGAEPEPDPLASYPNIPTAFGDRMLGMSCAHLDFTGDAVRSIRRFGEGGARLAMVMPLRSTNQTSIFDALTGMNPQARTETFEFARQLRREKDC